MSAATLVAALAAIGLHSRVEAEGTLAVLTVPEGARLADPALRDTVIALATLHGFSHVALELTDESSHSAALSGD